MLINKVTNAMLERNPSVKKGLEGFELMVEHDEKGKDFFFKPMSGNHANKLITLSEYPIQQSQFLVPSGLYKDVYFDSKNFDEQYQDEYEYILKRFVAKLGKGSTSKVFKSKEEWNEYRASAKTSGEIDGGMLTDSARIGAESTSSNKENNSTKHTKERALESFQPKCSKEDIKRWIEEERINIKALPQTLRLMFEEFLDKGCLQMVYSEKETIQTQSEHIEKKAKKVKAALEVKLYSLSSQFEDVCEVASKKAIKLETYIHVHLKHNGA